MKKQITLSAAFVAMVVSMAVAGPAEKEGGLVIQKGTFLGKIALVDTQEAVAFSNVQNVAAQLAKATKMNVVALRHAAARPEALQKELGAQVVLTVVNDPAAPTMLLAPEEHWGVVNVAKLTDDLKSERAKLRFRDPRARKEIIRAFSLVCGGGSSQFRGNMMNAATMKELDLSVDTIPVDMLDYYETHLKNYGVTKKVMVTYRMACEEGWAAAPTNAVQKAIWDEVHAIPDQPIKILPPNKKGK